MRLRWAVYLDLDQINALRLLVEDEGVADEGLEGAYRELVAAEEQAIRSEVAWMPTLSASLKDTEN